MPRYEYKVVPAPTRGLKAKGVKTAEARFSYAIQELMNGLAGDGWEYQRAETLPSVERSGLTSTTTEWRNVLVFRRLRDTDAEVFAPELLPPPDIAAPPPATPEKTLPPQTDTKDSGTVNIPEKPPVSDTADGPETVLKTAAGSWDNGVEDTSDVAGISPSLQTLAASRKSIKSDS